VRRRKAQLFKNIVRCLDNLCSIAQQGVSAAVPAIEDIPRNGQYFTSLLESTARGDERSALLSRLDDHDRPYTVTAATAEQVSPERINLTTLKADVTLNDGTWLMLQAKHGVFLQHANQLDLSGAVTLYRDDGTTMTTASASVDLKNGAAASAEPTHAEGPFGTLDAQGFTLTDKGTAIQFAGPAHLVLNGSSP